MPLLVFSNKSFFFLRILEGKKSFGGGKGFDRINLLADAFEQLGLIRFEVDTAMHQHGKIRKEILYRFSADLRSAGRNTSAPRAGCR